MANKPIPEMVPIEAKRLKNFAKFFKSYMSVSSVVVASLPIPLASFKLLPVFQQQVGTLSVYTSMFCFLLLGYIFYIRHSIARSLFYSFVSNENQNLQSEEESLKFQHIRGMNLRAAKRYTLLPAGLIFGSVLCVISYGLELSGILSEVKGHIAKLPVDTAYNLQSFNIHGDLGKDFSNDFIFKNYQIMDRTGSVILMTAYFGIFILAETAFMLMAIKEYLQDLLGLSEIDIIRGFKIHDDTHPSQIP